MRVANKRYAKFTHYIGRGTVFGNPFTHLPVGRTLASVQVGTRKDAVQAYEDWLRGTEWKEFMQQEREEVLDAIRRLPPDAVLGCYCFPLPCHGDVIIRLWEEMHK